MRIACFSPLPPRPSAIADYTRELLPALQDEGIEIDLWVAGGEPPPHGVDGFEIVRYDPADPATLGRLPDYDSLLYHLGDDARCHADLFSCFCRYPGVVVLHQVALHAFLFEYLRRRGSFRDYAERLEALYGAAGADFARAARRRPATALAGVHAERFPLFEDVVEAAQGVVVHSDYARRLIQARRPDVPAATIAHLAAPLPPSDDPAALRRRLGLAPDALVLVSFGDPASAHTGAVLEALSALPAGRRRKLACVVVGARSVGLEARARALDLGRVARFVPRVDRESMNDYLRASDVVVDLRDPTMGETSGVTCRALAAGKPCVVAASGWYAELPKEVVVRVGVAGAGGAETGALGAALQHLIDDATARLRLGQRAREFAADHFSPRRAARAYVDFLSSGIDPAEPLALSLQDEVASALAAWQVGPGDDAILGEVGEVLDRLFAPAADGGEPG